MDILPYIHKLLIITNILCTAIVVINIRNNFLQFKHFKACLRNTMLEENILNTFT